MHEDEDEDESSDSLLAAVARIPARDTERPAEWTPPPELEEYRLIQPIGRGGMGSVWLAEDRLLDRLVAIKFIAYEPDPHARDRFVIEARAAARLQHVNVVTVHRYGEIAGRPYLVSEYIRGESLDKLKKPVPWERVLELGIALSRGLAAAHRHGIVHRDIKPANAILTIDGDAKLVDFGLARLEREARESRPSAPSWAGIAAGSQDGLTAPGAIAGTPRYLAPEVRNGEPANRRSDVYGIGCVLYELVIGHAPIFDIQDLPTLPGGSKLDPLDVPPIGDRIDPKGARFAAVVDRCLSKDPEQRYASGDELREALEQIRPPVARGELPEGNPYRGLVPFDAEHRALFFGRGADIRAVIERMRADPFVLVTGDSGAGKSSLCRAGVLPEIVDGRLDDGVTWNVVQMVPGQRPLAALASLFATRIAIDEVVLVEAMRDEPTRLARELRRTIADKKSRHGVVLFVDQLEELCTIAERGEAAAFAAVLAEMTATPGLRLLATVRSDFLTRVAELPKLGAETARAIYLLRPLSSEGAREAVVGPALAKGGKFESEELVETLVTSVSDLPLLAFTLAQLWDARDQTTQTINTSSLEAIGGVRGALARHADGVLERLLPSQRTAARKILLRLVTAERTRIRRTAEELSVFDPAALDALVRGRLVVARGEDTPTFELAHERLIDGWPALAGWLSETSEAIAAHARLAAAVADWERLGHSRDALWGARQIADLDLVEPDDLGEAEARFAKASRHAVARRRWLIWGAALAIPTIGTAFYIGAKIVTQRDLDRRVAQKVSEGQNLLEEARRVSRAGSQLRTEAFAKFDAGPQQAAEQTWARALEHGSDAQAAYARAAATLEAAFLLDTGRDDVRRQLAEATFERIELAEREYRDEERSELEARLANYDREGVIAARRAARASLQIDIEPKHRTIKLVSEAGANADPASLVPGTYALTASAPGYESVTLPVRVARGQLAQVRFTLPTAVPDGFVYIPAGEFLYGSRDPEHIRAFQGAPPMHSRRTNAFMIARTEVTYASWIAFLEAQSAEERQRRAPRIESSATVQEGGKVQLREVDGTWELVINPAGEIVYTARAGTPIQYRDRSLRRIQDWLQFPVAGITPEDARAYTAWLAETGRVPRARMCDEVEWERAARGVDGRSHPNGKMTAEHANIDATYGRRDGGFGPDMVGSHPASTSPFGLVDMSGNVWELLETANHDGYVMRGGGYYTGTITSHLANRQPITPTYKHLHVGLRVCADP